MTPNEILSVIDEWRERVGDLVVVDPKDPRTWDAGVLAVERQDPTCGRVLHVRRDVISEVIGEDVQELLISMGAVPRKSEYRTRLGRKRVPTFDICLDILEAAVGDEIEVASAEHSLRSEIRSLRRELKRMRDERASDDKLVQLIHEVNEFAALRKKVEPLVVERKSEQNLAGWATLFLSDWHWDEQVDPAQIEHLNEYDHDIAVARSRRTFERTGDLLLNHMAGAYYEGVVVALGGDMLSGNIHSELRETNHAPITESILTLADELAAGIRMLAKEFPRVYVPGVVGNHGRYDRKPRAKGRVRENFDWLVYQLLSRQLADLPNVEFGISDAADIQYTIYSTRYRLTHGDQFRGGSGIAGKWPTLFRGDFKKRKRAVQTGTGGYDVLMMGHWHAYGMVDGLVVNGSLKGYDEYAYVSNFDYEPPTQALWVTHPELGITAAWPIYCDGPRSAKENDSFIYTGD